MQKSNMLKSAASSVALVAVLAGCAAAPPPDKPAEEVLKDGLMNLADVNAYSYDLALQGDLTDPMGQEMNFDVRLNGSLDNLDPADPKVVLNIDGSAEDSTGTGGSLKGELRMNTENVYFNIASLEITEEEIPAEFQELFGTWWMMPIPPGTFDELDVTISAEDEEQREKLKQELEKVDLFATPEFVGTENVMGESSHHYRVNIDKKGLLEFTKAAAEAEGETVSAAEMAQAEAELEKVDISGDVWVGVESGVLNKFEGSVNLKGGEGEPSGTISMTVSIGNLNEPVTIEVPADAEEFPAEQILGPMMMMGGGLPTPPTDDSMMMDDSMMDDSMMMDEDAMRDAMMESGMSEDEMEEMMMELESMEMEIQ